MFFPVIKERVKSSVSRLKHLQASNSDSDSMKSALKIGNLLVLEKYASKSVNIFSKNSY